jgi:uncharacterized membrane protein (DUF485 family)
LEVIKLASVAVLIPFGVGGLFAGLGLCRALTLWRTRLAWIDWAIAFVLNLPAFAFLAMFVSHMQTVGLSGAAARVMLGVGGFGLGWILGLVFIANAAGSRANIEESR